MKLHNRPYHWHQRDELSVGNHMLPNWKMVIFLSRFTRISCFGGPENKTVGAEKKDKYIWMSEHEDMRANSYVNKPWH